MAMPDFSNAVSKILFYCQKYWYIIVVFIILLWILSLLKQRKKQREYYDEIKRHRDIVNKELSFNPCPYKFLVIKSFYGKKRVLGKIAGYYTDNIKFRLDLPPKDKQIKELMELRDSILLKKPKAKEVNFDIITFSIKTNKIGITDNFSIWFGEPTIFSFFKREMEIDSLKREINLITGIDFKYRDGRFISTSEPDKLNLFAFGELYRTLHDHSMNAMGYQQKRFAEIKDEYAFQLSFKEHEAKIEEAKRKGVIERT